MYYMSYVLKGTRIWIPDKDSVWIGGTLLEDLKDDHLVVQLENDQVGML